MGVELPAAFPRMTYAEAMDRYGSDKPDVRYDLQFHDVTAAVQGTHFRFDPGATATCSVNGMLRCCAVLCSALSDAKQVAYCKFGHQLCILLLKSQCVGNLPKAGKS